MEGSVGAPPQRVCPKCARISWATGPRCPYCRGRFRRAVVTPWMLALTAVVVLAGVAAMLIVGAHMVNQRLDRRVADVQQQFDASLNRFRADVNKELDARLPAAGAVTPVPSAVPTPTPSPSATPTPAPSSTATPRPSATPTPTATPRAP